MKRLVFGIFIVVVFSGVSNCEEYKELKGRISAKYEAAVPVQWGENVAGVLTKLDTKDKAVALTFDACGSKNDGFDIKLFDYLVKKKIPATFFISGRWIDRHPEEFKLIASNSLFEIENHGLEHKPASVNGRSVYGIKGTENPGEFIDEVELNAEKIEKLTGKKPRYYRSGTAYYDDVAVKIVKDLGYKIAGFSVLGDMGATYSKAQVIKALKSASAGSVIICHINHPEKETGKGVIASIPILKTAGYKFAKLSDFDLK
jgi:peptidoglycan/xylan/chitin deacetylase (PgdA/CDA1 family)